MSLVAPNFSDHATTGQPLKDGIFNFFLPSEEECNSTPDENLEPNSADLKSSRTGEVWYKSLEESHSAQIQKRSLLGHLICSEDTQKKILELDIYCILESEGVTEIGALYKVSPPKFVLIFGSKMVKEKLQGTEIQCRFGDSEIKLSFHKRTEPLRNEKEPIFITINLPEYISDQAVRLVFFHFGEVLSVFKDRHKFNGKIRNGKRHVRIFPVGGDPAILPRKIAFHGGVSRDAIFAKNVVLCYKCKTRHMLGVNCPVVSPTPEGSDMSCTEQSETPRDSKTPEKDDPSVKNQPSVESRQEMSSIEERTDGEDSWTDGTGNDSDSDSSDGDGSDLAFSVPETPLQKPVTSASQMNLAENQSSNDSTKNIQVSDTRTMKSLRDFKIPHLDRKLNSTDNIDRILKKINLRVTLNKINLTKETVTTMLDLLDNKRNKDYLNILSSHTVRLKSYHNMNHLPEKLDDILYGIATRQWPVIMFIISDKTH